MVQGDTTLLDSLLDLMRANAATSLAQSTTSSVAVNTTLDCVLPSSFSQSQLALTNSTEVAIDMRILAVKTVKALVLVRILTPYILEE